MDKGLGLYNGLIVQEYQTAEELSIVAFHFFYPEFAGQIWKSTDKGFSVAHIGSDRQKWDLLGRDFFFYFLNQKVRTFVKCMLEIF